MTWREWIARKLDPKLAREADRYKYLRLQIDDAHRWLGEFESVGHVLTWLREIDEDHWRHLGEPAKGKLPPGIEDLRELMRRSAEIPF